MNPKHPIAEPLPTCLTDFFVKLVSWIDEGHDAVTIPSDDSIYDKFISGGLGDDGNFYFTYFLHKGSIFSWLLKLSANQIRTIADGDTVSFDLFFCGNPTCGNRFQAPDILCGYCSFWERFSCPPRDQVHACTSLMEWIKLFRKYNPDAPPWADKGAYNMTPDLFGQLGPWVRGK